MADSALSLDSLLGGMNFSDLSFANPVGLGINVVLSTIVSGIVILLIVEIFAKKFSEHVKPMNAFVLSLIVSMINLFGIVPLLSGLASSLPMAGVIGMLLPVVVWVVLVKFFFKELAISHALMIGVICYLLSIFLIPSLVSMAAGFMPVI